MFLIFQFKSYFVMSELKIIRDKMEMWLTEWNECSQMSELWYMGSGHLHKFSSPSYWIVLLLNKCFPCVSLVSLKVHYFINSLCLQVHLLFFQASETKVFSNNSFNSLKPITFIPQRFSVLPMTQRLLKMGLPIHKISYSCASSELEGDRFLTHH